MVRFIFPLFNFTEFLTPTQHNIKEVEFSIQGLGTMSHLVKTCEGTTEFKTSDYTGGPLGELSAERKQIVGLFQVLLFLPLEFRTLIFLVKY